MATTEIPCSIAKNSLLAGKFLVQAAGCPPAQPCSGLLFGSVTKQFQSLGPDLFRFAPMELGTVSGADKRSTVRHNPIDLASGGLRFADPPCKDGR